MYITSKKYTKDGRTRFGSSIFIDDIKEERVDRLTGFQRDPAILFSILLILFCKIISANYLGIFITIPVFVVLYFKGDKNIRITYTTHRLLLEREYKHPRFVKFIANTFIGIVIFIPIRFLLNIDQLSSRMENMAKLFQFLQLYDTRFFLYRNFVNRNYFALQTFDGIITLSICLWFAIQYKKIHFEFSEVNLRNVSEQLIRLKSINTLRGITSLVIGYLIFQFLYFNRFSITFLISVIILFQFIPRIAFVHLTLIGPSNMEIVRGVVISQKEMSNITRTTAITYGWSPQKDDRTREFPENIVPNEIASTYETGLRSYSAEAFKQANILGMITSAIINVVVIITLIRYSFQFDADVLDIIFLIFLALVIITIGLFITFTGLNQIRQETQQDEKLFIGEQFIGRQTGNSLWILSGKSTEGTTVQRGRTSKMIRFDKSRGMVVEWEKFTLLLILLVVILAIGIWNYLGAINLQAIPLLFPSLIDLGLEFLEQKATAELEFFIITGFVIWALTLFFYPRYYARSRPSLYIDLEYASIEPVVLKDFEEHQNASMQFTKSLISASQTTSRGTSNRPGTFILVLHGSGQFGEGNYLKFYIGENHRTSKIMIPIEQNTIIMDNIITSAVKGYPELNVIIELYNADDECIFSAYNNINILYQRQCVETIEFGIFGTLELVATIKKQKA